MTHDSNYWGNYGANQSNSGYDDFKRQGLSDTQATEAAQVARRARDGGSKS